MIPFAFEASDFRIRLDGYGIGFTHGVMKEHGWAYENP
jgi:hypothetical protein